MRRLVCVFVLAVLLGGCATMSLSDIGSQNAKNLEKLTVGMSEQEVLNIMGTKKINGTIWDFYTGIKNPYRSEVVQVKSGKALKILYYFTYINKSTAWQTHSVTNNDLTPLIFEDGKFIGSGLELLQENSQ